MPPEAEGAPPAAEEPGAAIRERILKRIEARLRADDLRVRRMVERILEEELGGPRAAEEPRDARRAEDLRERVREFLEGAEASPGKPARPAREDGWNAEALIDELFAGAEGAKEGSLRHWLGRLGPSPEGEAMREFLREELRALAPSLRRLAERDDGGRWRLRGDAEEFLRAWLEDELAQGGDKKPDDGKEGKKGKEGGGPAKEGGARARLGIHAAAPTAEERTEAGLGKGVGLRVVRVAPGSAADRAGLRPGDFVARIEGKDATERELAGFLAAAEPGEEIVLELRRRREGAPAGESAYERVEARVVLDPAR